MHAYCDGSNPGSPAPAPRVRDAARASAPLNTAPPSSSALVYLFAEQCEARMPVSGHQAAGVLGGSLAVFVAAAVLEHYPDSLLVLLLVGGVLQLWSRIVERDLPRVWTLHIGSAQHAPGPALRTTHETFAAALFAVALWSLWQEGRIALELPAQRRLLKWRRQPVWIRPRTERDLALPHDGCLEAVILAQLPPTAAMRPDHVLQAWLGDDEQVRWHNVILTVMDHVRDLGAPGDHRAAWPLKSDFAGAFQTLSGRWAAFQEDEPALYRALLRECRAAFPSERRGDASDQDDWFDLDDGDVDD